MEVVLGEYHWPTYITDRATVRAPTESFVIWGTTMDLLMVVHSATNRTGKQRRGSRSFLAAIIANRHWPREFTPVLVVQYVCRLPDTRPGRSFTMH